MIEAGESLMQDAGNLKLDVGDILADQVGTLSAIREQEKAASEGRPGRKGLSVIDFPELLGMDIPERSKLFPWLPEGGLSMVYGPRGIGKTYFTLTLAASLCSGSSFMKWTKPVKPVGVVIIDGEMALTDLRARLTALLIAQPTKPLKIISGEAIFAKIDRDINLVDNNHQSDVLTILDDNKDLKLVIVDNVSCLFSGLRESSKDDWEKITPWLLAMRRRGVAVLLVHHAGKGGDQRGTSGREDLLDTVISLEKVHGGKDSGAKFIVKFTKCRGAYGSDVEPFEAALDLDSPELWTWKPVDESTYERMLDMARDGVDSVTDMAEELGVSKGLISRLKKKAQEAGDLLPGKFIQVPEDGI
ncbi:MAG: AAA family ATPase [Deltaproteobacteria bacterium]|nr:AAA family ATPase [Deltaproteobacteria bacterium]